MQRNSVGIQTATEWQRHSLAWRFQLLRTFAAARPIRSVFSSSCS